MPRMPSPGRSRRYRRVAVTYTVVREQVPTSWPALSTPDAAAEFARELLAAHDNDREHVWSAPGSARGRARDGRHSLRACIRPLRGAFHGSGP
jgi:hypothetical protein